MLLALARARVLTWRELKIDLPACFSSYWILCFLLKFIFAAIKYLKKCFKPVWIHNCHSSSADVIKVFSDLNTLKFQVMARSASFSSISFFETSDGLITLNSLVTSHHKRKMFVVRKCKKFWFLKKEIVSPGKWKLRAHKRAICG